MISRCTLALSLLLMPGVVAAHEFWLEPVEYRIAAGENAVVEMKVGEAMKGSTYAYIPANFTRFDVIHDGAAVPVEGRAGDNPAMNMPLGEPGLHTVVHVTRDYTLTYQEWDKFKNFTTHKDFPWAIEQHLARGLPETGFKERYIRYAKSLIAVGDGAGADVEAGLVTEIVALANPYTDDLSGGMPVQVLYEGEPRGDTQVELFEKSADGTVEITQHRTDAEGRAVLPVRPGMSYLVDSVVMRPLEPAADGDPVWESLWAALTFEIPE